MILNNVQSVITAAGDSRPLFIPSGFGSPKSLVVWHGKEVIINALESYVINFDGACVALHEEEDSDWAISSVIWKNIQPFGLPKSDLELWELWRPHWLLWRGWTLMPHSSWLQGIQLSKVGSPVRSKDFYP